jgi:hypothetical protein
LFGYHYSISEALSRFGEGIGYHYSISEALSRFGEGIVVRYPGLSVMPLAFC